jgi:hypothetical protein
VFHAAVFFDTGSGLAYLTASRKTCRSASGIVLVKASCVPLYAGMIAPMSPCCCWAGFDAMYACSACAAALFFEASATTFETPWMTVACSLPLGSG